MKLFHIKVFDTFSSCGLLPTNKGFTLFLNFYLLMASSVDDYLDKRKYTVFSIKLANVQNL